MFLYLSTTEVVFQDWDFAFDTRDLANKQKDFAARTMDFSPVSDVICGTPHNFLGTQLTQLEQSAQDRAVAKSTAFLRWGTSKCAARYNGDIDGDMVGICHMSGNRLVQNQQTLGIWPSKTRFWTTKTSENQEQLGFNQPNNQDLVWQHGIWPTKIALKPLSLSAGNW